MIPSFEQVAAFHGHSCPGLAIGYRAALAALERAGARDVDEELVAVVETDACGVDAIQYVLGCTAGKGNLIFRDHGKQVFTVGSRQTGEAVRIALRPDPSPSPAAKSLRDKVYSGDATEAERSEFFAGQRERLGRILSAGTEEIFSITRSTLDLPPKARIFSSVVCQFCGEGVMEPRARVRDGRTACIPCAEDYARRW